MQCLRTALVRAARPDIDFRRCQSRRSEPALECGLLRPRLQLHWAGTQRAARSKAQHTRAYEHEVFALARETGMTGRLGRDTTL